MKRMTWDKLLSTKRVAEYAICSISKRYPSQYVDPRSAFEKDCDQILFSYPFRRLQDKTQVIPFPEFDFVHTRLTHSLEVASIGRSFGKLVFPIIKNEIELHLSQQGITASDIGALVAAACYAHDIGNPPFGHKGESAISFYFIDSGQFQPYWLDLEATITYKEDKVVISSQTEMGHIFENVIPKDEFLSQQKIWNDLSSFEGNANGFRIITQNCDNGINPTSALLGTFTKYPRESFICNDSKEKRKQYKSQSKYGFFQSEKIIFKEVAEELGLIPVNNVESSDIAYKRHPLAFLMEAADDIAYGMIDFEDGCRLGIIDFEKQYSSINIRDKTNNKNNLTEINHSPREILTKIASYDKSFDLEKVSELKDYKSLISYLRSKVINVMIHSCFEVFQNNYLDIMNGTYDKSLIVDVIPSLLELWDKMKSLVRKFVYNYSPVLQSEASGFEVMHHLIQSLGMTSGICFSCKEIPDSKQTTFGSLLPEEYFISEEIEGMLTIEEKYKRILKVLDYVSGMTDNYAIALYRKIKGISLQTH